MLGLIANDDGTLLRRDAIAHGADDNALLRAVRSGHLVRIRQGAYVLRGVWDSSDAVERHRLLLSAVRRQYDDRVAASHTSACIKHGGPTWGLRLESAHLTNLYGITERNQGKVVHHRGSCRVDDVTRDDAGWITTPTRTALDTASLAPQEPAVAVVDWYLASRLTTREELETAFATMKHWPDTLALHRVLQLADGRAESVGETRTRLLCRRQHLPAPVAQLEIHHPNGRLAGRIDFAWPEHGLMMEFDGMQKYHRFRRTGESIEATVVREKLREDVLRELTGWHMIRIVWSDLDHPKATAARIQRAMMLSTRPPAASS
ncbi:type IV toxin-antitoxin system AbiEi family antitoxin domain-containing protein [Pimelobacter simplex]|uniref:type IV toxin-antitoxin system AbiEi family antitoxin domain-containing protein n=1 Tax=Nocardioides simplex TaxID=2045 RepID=UPI00214FFCBA|nr:type IV toxin-antitoxin system AbiEi family antitoxin domain-containing protein [Pimelobacter simplex]UUW88226.1 type IV toxin-antitoxin system AbiEi family antitoxin domain-containing protein [Pimelobacter simplex]UUW97731.1 type IV toxin-antitoxin system AbiEi family antitoxin domain-containing protein [Pimelobacter simplex]